MKTAAELFHACDNQELYDSLPQRLEEALEDPTLAAECYAFLPEICAETPLMKYHIPRRSTSLLATSRP